MKQLQITLFGRLDVRCGPDALPGCAHLKVGELLCYLLLNRDRPHSRENLATLLWGDHCTTVRSKKYLSNTLWRLRSLIEPHVGPSIRTILSAEDGWIELKSTQCFWVDVYAFDQAYREVKEVPIEYLQPHHAQTLSDAVDLYKGRLLSSWHHEWCTVERHRLHHMYLMMLERLSEYCQRAKKYEQALFHAERILYHDKAHEGAHQRIMCLLAKMGDRTSALRQYSFCVGVLRDELDTSPAPSTVRLYEQLRMSQGSTI